LFLSHEASVAPWIATVSSAQSKGYTCVTTQHSTRIRSHHQLQSNQKREKEKRQEGKKQEEREYIYGTKAYAMQQEKNSI
jgi:hypothetical protein